MGIALVHRSESDKTRQVANSNKLCVSVCVCQTVITTCTFVSNREEKREESRIVSSLVQTKGMEAHELSLEARL